MIVKKNILLQFSSPELVEAALYSSDYLRLIEYNKPTPNDQEVTHFLLFLL